MELKNDLPTVLLPVVSVVRELDSKLILAAALSANGCRAIVAHKDYAALIGRQSNLLVWHGKELFAHDPRHPRNHTADLLFKNGSSVVYMQDEGGMFQACSWREQVIEKHQIDTLRKYPINRLLTWGRKQAEVISDYAPELTGCLVATGSARFDICKPEYGWISQQVVDGLQIKYGSFILICSRFGSIIHAKGVQQFFRQKLGTKKIPKILTLERASELWFTKWRQDVHDFADFVVLVKELASAYPARKIVIRPHPSESMLFYRQAFSTFSNVEVIREGNVLTWIRGAALVIHSNCTTGIEAVLAGRPVLNLLPGDEDRVHLDVEVAREAGTVAHSVTEALEIIVTLLEHGAPKQEWSDHAASILNNLTQDAIPILVEETLSVIRQQGITKTRLVLPAYFSRKFMSNVVMPMMRRRTRVSRTYGEQMRPPFNRDQIDELLDGCRSQYPNAGYIRTSTKDCVVIDPK